jgi:hypothetical protein
MDQQRLFIIKHELLKISVTSFAAETHTADWTVAEGAIENGKVMYVPSRNTNATVSRAEAQYLMPVKTFIKNNTSK